MKCKCSLNNQYQTIGLCDVEKFNEKISKFQDQSYSQLSLPEQITLPKNFPNLKSILKLYLDIEIKSTKIVTTPMSNSSSYEGLKLTGKMLLVHGVLNQTIIYTSDKDVNLNQQAKYSLRLNPPFSTYIILDSEATKNVDSYYIYPYIENVSLIPLSKRTLNKSITLFLFAHNMRSQQIPPIPASDLLSNSFIFTSFDTNEEIAKIEFDKTNKKLIVSSTGIPYNGKFTNAFIFKLTNSYQSQSKGLAIIKGDSNADEFKNKLNNINFEYGDLINLNFSNKSKVVLTNYPNKDITYGMIALSNQGFEITPDGIVPYILPNSIILNSINNTPVVIVQFDIVNNLFLVNSTGNLSNPKGSLDYFKMTLYEPDGITEKLSSKIAGESDAENFELDFLNENFEYGDIVKLYCEESNRVIVTNIHDSNNLNKNEKSFKITESGLEIFVPEVEKLQNKITVKSVNGIEVLSIEFDNTSKKFIVESTGEIPDSSSTDVYFTAILRDNFASHTFEASLLSNDNGNSFKSTLNDIEFESGYNKLQLFFKNNFSIEISNYPSLGETYTPKFNACIFDITNNGLVDGAFESVLSIVNDDNEEMATMLFVKTPYNPKILLSSTKAISTNRLKDFQKYIKLARYSSTSIENYSFIINNQDASSFSKSFDEITIQPDIDTLRISNIFPNKITITNFKDSLEYKVLEEPELFKVTRSKLVPYNLTYNKIRVKNKDDTSVLFIYFDKIDDKTIYIEAYSTGIINKDSDYFYFKIRDQNQQIAKFDERIEKNNSADAVYISYNCNLSKDFSFGDILELGYSDSSLVEIFDYPDKDVTSNPTGSSQKFLITELGLKEFIPIPPVIDKLSTAFIFKSFEADEEIAKVEFNKANMRLMVTSTGNIYDKDDGSSVFTFELIEVSAGIKGSSKIKGDKDASTFKEDLDNVSFAYGDIVTIGYDDKTKLDLTNYPNENDTYNMQHPNFEAFLITSTGIIQYVLPNNIIVNNIDNDLMLTIQFAIINKSFLLSSTDEIADSSSGEEIYFKASLYSPDGTIEKISSYIVSKENSDEFVSDFGEAIFQYNNLLKLEYKDSSKITITNFPDSSTPIYNPKEIEEWFKITKSGLIKFTPK